jgi:hypothetical protein
VRMRNRKRRHEMRGRWDGVVARGLADRMLIQNL